MTYVVEITRDVSGAWLANVPDLPGAHTWAGTRAELEGCVREAIALAEDFPEGVEAGLAVTFRETAR